MKTRHFQIATFFLLAFLQIPPVHAQRSSGSRGVNWANLPMGYNIMWDFEDGVLRIWSVEDFKNPFGTTHVSWKDCILPYKAYMDDPLYPANDDWKFYTEGDDHWKGLEDISPAYPPFTETPWYPIRELVRQIQIDGSIYYIGSFSLLYFPNCRSVILHDGVEDIEIGNFSHMSNIRHLYFPSSLDYIGPLTFIKSARGKLELVCNIPKPIKLIRAYHFSSSLAYMCSRAFSWVQGDASFLHVVSEEAVGLYKEWWEHSNGFPTPIIHPWVDAFKNMLHRTQPVVEGVDISGGNIVLAPTLNPKHQLSATLIPSNAMRSTGRAGETGSGVTWNIGNYQSTDTEDNIAKVTGDGGLLTFKNLGKTRVYVTTNSPGYYTCREVNVLNDEITESGIQITVENIYGTKTYGVTPAYKSKPTGMQTEIPEYAFKVLYIEGDFEITAKCAPSSIIKGTGKFRAGSKAGDTTLIIKVTAEDKTVKEYNVVVHVIDPYGNGWHLSGDTLIVGNRDWYKSILRYDQSPWYRYRQYIKHVSFDKHLTVIPLMLYNCYNIKELHLPPYLKEIGDNAFTGCDNPGKIIFEAAIPPKVNRCTFLGSKGLHMGNKTVLHIHGEARSAYSNTDCWRDFKHIETLENNDVSLKSLDIRYHILTPAFDKDIFEYSVIVPRDLYSIIIDAQSTDPDAQVGGQGIFKPVVFEDTVFTVGVTAANHADRNEYTINIRHIGSDAMLKFIKINDLQLYPAFNKDTLDYVCIVPDSVEIIRLSAEAAHRYAKLSYNPEHKIDRGKTTFNIRFCFGRLINRRGIDCAGEFGPG